MAAYAQTIFEAGHVARIHQRAGVSGPSERPDFRADPHATLPSASVALVHFRNGVPVTDSPTIAREFVRRHANVLRELDSLISDGTISQLDFESAEYLDHQGKPRRMIELTERGALIAIPFMGGRNSRLGQVRLVEAFLAMRSVLHSTCPTSIRACRDKPATARSETKDRELLLSLVAAAVARRRLGFSAAYIAINEFVGARHFRDMTCDQVAKAEEFGARLLMGNTTASDIKCIEQSRIKRFGNSAQMMLPCFADHDQEGVHA